MASDDYARQLRGDRGAYERYLAGMDASMQQKVALMAAHLLSQGRVADMGMGSGTGSEALAALYPGLDVVGVDVSPQMVELARERYDRPNLDFILGDIATPVFDPDSLDGILDSSVLHHVTSFNGYDRAAAGAAIAAQVRQLRDHGVLIVRDFLDPGPGEVFLDLPADDGADCADGGDEADPETCSSAALLERFSREFRSLYDAPGFPLQHVDEGHGGDEADSLPPGWRRYRLSKTHAVEFVLRKDYRRDWVSEVQEEYTYATQAEFEKMFAAHGLRVLASTPLRNPWIVRNRFRGKFALRDLDGSLLEDPATNYVIVGERVPAGVGVRFSEGDERPPLGFLTMSHYRHRVTGKVMDLVARPHLTIDAIPWFTHDDDVFVVARMSYPRPILIAGQGTGATVGQGTGVEPVALDGARAPGFSTEPLTIIQDDAPVAQTIEDALAARVGLSPETILGFAAGGTYFPSPGGLREEVRSMFVEIEPVFVHRDIPSTSGFSTSGRVGAIEARQLLRAAQVGGLPDARLELNAYELLQSLGRPPGPWIGEALALTDGPEPAVRRTASALRAIPARRRFSPARPTESAGFLTLSCKSFREHDADAKLLHERTLEYVAPAALSPRTVVVALLRRYRGDVYIGLDDDDLPAAQSISGNSNLLVAPAWRLPTEISSMTPARAWLAERLGREYALELGELATLGGRYHPSPGATPEVVHPLAAEVIAEGSDGRAILWTPLRELLRDDSLLRDGHLRVVAWRSAHALGLL
ncbi:methyltransferase domain-containing protein [Haliangium sp.]|uniref:methyltransferase domain-containing protein n=1 Tax=Haliangium sp. TaxID=2663208 RepID=UPI003D0BA3C6